jgi:glycopeptide antibiotics resistance protein
VESANFLIKDVVGNVVVFVPIGVAAAGALRPMSSWRRFGLAVVGGFLLSLFIETVQFQIATRATDVDDVIFNTLGAAIGAASLVLWRRFSAT